jgi:hypothetical protein
MPPFLPNLLKQAGNEDENPTARLFAAATLKAELDEWLPVLAQAARDAGHTWADLGDALGVTKQAVQKRFGGSDVKNWVYDTAEDGERRMRPASSEDLARLRAVGVELPNRGGDTSSQ